MKIPALLAVALSFTAQTAWAQAGPVDDGELTVATARGGATRTEVAIHTTPASPAGSPAAPIANPTGLAIELSYRLRAAWATLAHVGSTRAGVYAVTLRDLRGRAVFAREWDARAGKFAVPMEGLPRGGYTLAIAEAGEAVRTWRLER